VTISIKVNDNCHSRCGRRTRRCCGCYVMCSASPERSSAAVSRWWGVQPCMWMALAAVLHSVGSVGNGAVTTIEAVSATPEGKALQQAWVDLNVVQCGYCQSGQIMSAAALRSRRPSPPSDDIECGDVRQCLSLWTYQLSARRFLGPRSEESPWLTTL